MTAIARQRAFIGHLMKSTGARNHQELAALLKLDPSFFSKLYNQPKPGMMLSTLAGISERTGIKVSMLAGWLAGEDEKKPA